MDRRAFVTDAFVTDLGAVLAAPLAATAESGMIPLVPRVHHDVEEAGAHGPWGSRRGKNEGCTMPPYEFMC